MSENVYLNVPFAEKDAAKQLGARWDPEKKKWYSEPGNKALLKKFGPKTTTAANAANNVATAVVETTGIEPKKSITRLVGENQQYQGNVLVVDLLPKSCWFNIIRFCVQEDDWADLRRMLAIRSEYKCECCDTLCYKNGMFLEALEKWEYNASTTTMKLVRIMSVCKPCYEAARCRDKQHTIDRLMDVNGWDSQEAISHINEAYSLLTMKNDIQWTVDVKLLTNNGVRLAEDKRRKAAKAAVTVKKISAEPVCAIDSDEEAVAYDYVEPDMKKITISGSKKIAHRTPEKTVQEMERQQDIKSEIKKIVISQIKSRTTEPKRKGECMIDSDSD